MSLTYNTTVYGNIHVSTISYNDKGIKVRFSHRRPLEDWEEDINLLAINLKLLRPQDPLGVQ